MAAAALTSTCAAAVWLVWRGQRLPAKYTVEGSVSLDGRALDLAVIQFIPLPPLAAKKTGGEIKAGHYRIESEDGLLAGSYRVEIVPYINPFAAAPTDSHAAADAKPKLLVIPDRYNRQSILKVEASAGENHFDFPLSTNPAAAGAQPAAQPAM